MEVSKSRGVHYISSRYSFNVNTLIPGWSKERVAILLQCHQLNQGVFDRFNFTVVFLRDSCDFSASAGLGVE